MPIVTLGAAIMDNSSMNTVMHQQQQQPTPEQMAANHPMVTNSMARKKKSERPLAVPPVNLLDFNSHSYANTSGMTNHGFAQDAAGSMLSPVSLLEAAGHASNSHNGSRLNMTRDTTLGDADSDPNNISPSNGILKDHHHHHHHAQQQQQQQQQEVIEVQILPQDEKWGEVNNTSIVDYGPIDDANGNNAQMDKWRLNTDRGMLFRIKRHLSTFFTGFLSLLAFISPILMVILPSAIGDDVLHLREHQLQCGVECDGLLVSLAFKLFILAVGSWAVFARPARATLPRVQVYRAVIRFLVLLLLVSFWLFYASHLVNEPELVRYRGLVNFAQSLTDALLFVVYLAVLLMEIRHRQTRFYVKVLRSPDGESKGFVCGSMSVQESAAFILDKYYSEFPIYNPYLEHGRKSQKMDHNDGNSTVVSVASRSKDKFYEEFEFERKVKKRRARLIAATDEAFTLIKRINGTEKSSMETYEAAQAIFPTFSRPLQKYLRSTRQQPRHSTESIMDHLATCLSFDMSPKAFLEKYLISTPVLQNDQELKDSQRWSLVSEKSLYRGLQSGMTFQLRQGDVSLLCQVHSLPRLNLSEEIIESKSNKFVLRINSETSV